MSTRNLIETYLSEKEAEQFAEWGWGKDYKTIVFTSKEGIDLWNEKHGDQFIIDGSRRPIDDIPIMINIWRKKNEK